MTSQGCFVLRDNLGLKRVWVGKAGSSVAMVAVHPRGSKLSLYALQSRGTMFIGYQNAFPVG